jgi:hypothetical protein
MASFNLRTIREDETMRRLCWSGCFLAVLLSGCGQSKVKPKGRLLKDGAPVVLKDEDEFVHIFFDPVVAEGQSHPGDVYAANYNRDDGTFEVVGKDGAGLPPGKYRITIEHALRKKDLLQGKFNAANTPFVRDVDGRTGDIVLDLSKPQG